MMQPQNSSHTPQPLDPVDTLILSIQSEHSLQPSWPSETLAQSFDTITDPPQFPFRHSVSHQPSNFRSPSTPPNRLPPRHTITRTRSPTRNHPVFSKSLQHHLTPPLHPNSVSEVSSLEQFHQTFALPQTIAGSYLTKHQSLPTTPLQYPVSTMEQVVSPTSPHPITASPSQEVPTVDSEKYVRESANTAESVKMRYRDQLKKQQTAREDAARDRGSPMTAKEKERERSRRESAVTRKRAEVYIKELENVSRRLPFLEMKLHILELELQRFCNPPEQHIAHSQHLSAHLPPKSEPELIFSPASQQTTTTVINQMQQLDLRLDNASETG